MDIYRTRFTEDRMSMIANTDQPLAISYLRFSTPEQEQGDSFRRQTKMADDYAALHGLRLDEEFRFEDRGVSAYRGANNRIGALGAIQRAAEDGVIPVGSYLLVENLDRLSRETPWKAVGKLQSIVGAGLIVVTLNDGAVFSEETMNGEDGMLRLFGAIISMSRANEESRIKSGRLTAAWEAKREEASATGKRLTKIAPAWLSAEGEDDWEIDKQKVAIVQRVFEMYRDGTGKDGIAKALNREGVEPLGRGGRWHPSAVQKLLGNASVIGVCTPHRTVVIEGKKGREPLEPIAGYFPPIIEQSLWDDVQARRRAVKPRGASARHPVQNVLAGIARCPRCEGSMTRVQKGARSTPKLVCSAAKNGKGCQYITTDYRVIEKALRENGLAAVATAPLGEQSAKLEADLEGIEGSIDLVIQRLENIVSEEAGHGSTPALRKARREAEGELQRLLDGRSDLEARIVEASPLAVKGRMASLENVLARGLSDDTEPASPKEVSEALQRTCAAVVVDDGAKAIELHWRHGGVSRIVFGFPPRGHDGEG